MNKIELRERITLMLQSIAITAVRAQEPNISLEEMMEYISDISDDLKKLEDSHLKLYLSQSETDKKGGN